MNIFTDNEYNSGDGMLTSVWGPALWHVLHTISFNYPVKPTNIQKKQYKSFILSLKNILPCGACRKNLKTNLNNMPPLDDYLNSRQDFSYWVYLLHEQVNTMLGKVSNLDYNDVRDLYENFRARCGSRKRQRVENGCTEPIIGKRSKCTINIVPHTSRRKTFNVSKNCFSKLQTPNSELQT